jgi:hypothetical protein
MEGTLRVLLLQPLPECRGRMLCLIHCEVCVCRAKNGMAAAEARCTPRASGARGLPEAACKQTFTRAVTCSCQRRRLVPPQRTATARCACTASSGAGRASGHTSLFIDGLAPFQSSRTHPRPLPDTDGTHTLAERNLARSKPAKQCTSQWPEEPGATRSIPF